MLLHVEERHAFLVKKINVARTRSVVMSKLILQDYHKFFILKFHNPDFQTNFHDFP